MAISVRLLLWNAFAESLFPLQSKERRDTMLIRAEAISPMTNTRTASSQEKCKPWKVNTIKYAQAIRMICSVSWETAGPPELLLP